MIGAHDSEEAERTAARAALSRALARVGAQDRAAFTEVYGATSAKLLGICVRILGDRAEAEEILQEVYVTVWHKAGTFDPARASPITWLAFIARNRALDRLRARRVRAPEPLGPDALDVADPAASATERMEASEDARRLLACMGELEARQAAAIRQTFFGGSTYAELATMQEVPLGTVKSWIRRGLLRLRECLGR